jgi:hypothetical protein
VALYSTTEKSKATLEKIFQEHIINKTMKNTAFGQSYDSKEEMEFFKKALEKEEKAAAKSFQENIINNPMWDELLTPEGQEEFLNCVNNPATCNIPLIIDKSAIFIPGACKAREHYDTITANFRREIAGGNEDNINIILDNYLEKYLTKEGRMYFFIPGKIIYDHGTALQWLREMYTLLYNITWIYL